MDSSRYWQPLWPIALSALLVCCAALALPAQDLSTANRAYRAQRYAEAIEAYERLLQQGYHSPALYHNLGNAYFRAGQLGLAVLNYERALKLAPGDAQTEQSLRVVRGQLELSGEGLALPGIWRAWQGLQGLLSANGWVALGLICLWLAVSGLLLWLFHRARPYKKAGFIGGLALIGLSLLLFLLAYSRTQQQYGQHYAIVLLPQTELRVAPEDESQALQPLYEGQKVQILERIGPWYLVRLPDASEGWLPADAAAQI